jgi:hypothetical protein
VDLHPAENRGYRELYLTGSACVRRLARLAPAHQGGSARPALDKAVSAITEMLTELRPLTAGHDLYGGLAAESGGAQIGAVRSAVGDRFLERNQALRFAVGEIEHLATLLTYLRVVSETGGHADLADFSDTWERRLRGHVGALRRATRELGSDPDLAIRPVDESPLGRTAHAAAWAAGAVGEWADRQHGRRSEPG